jgi:SSS family transporter
MPPSSMPASPPMEAPALATVDVVLIVLYFLMVALVGIGFCIKERNAAAAGATAASSDEFFLAGRSMRWPAIGLSLFVSNIGSEHLLGLAGSAAASGIAVGWFEWSAALHLLVLGWLFSPIYLRSGIATLPEYIERRYSKGLRAMLSCISLFIYVFTKLSVSVFSGATVLRSVFGWNRELAAAGLVLLTALYTAMGGLAAVIVTDVAQSLVLLVGATCMAVVGFSEVGGLDGLREAPPASLNATEWRTFFHMYRPADDANYPTLGMMLGTNVGGLWYWCLDQAIVQRVLSARSTPHARGSTIFAGFLKIAPVFLMVMPGLVARKLFDEELAVVGTNEALPLMMKRLLPPGMLGLNLAATVAA